MTPRTAMENAGSSVDGVRSRTEEGLAVPSPDAASLVSTGALRRLEGGAWLNCVSCSRPPEVAVRLASDRRGSWSWLGLARPCSAGCRWRGVPFPTSGLVLQARLLDRHSRVSFRTLPALRK